MARSYYQRSGGQYKSKSGCSGCFWILLEPIFNVFKPVFVIAMFALGLAGVAMYEKGLTNSQEQRTHTDVDSPVDNSKPRVVPPLPPPSITPNDISKDAPKENIPNDAWVKDAEKLYSEKWEMPKPFLMPLTEALMGNIGIDLLIEPLFFPSLSVYLDSKNEAQFMTFKCAGMVVKKELISDYSLHVLHCEDVNSFKSTQRFEGPTIASSKIYRSKINNVGANSDEIGPMGVRLSLDNASLLTHKLITQSGVFVVIIQGLYNGKQSLLGWRFFKPMLDVNLIAGKKLLDKIEQRQTALKKSNYGAALKEQLKLTAGEKYCIRYIYNKARAEGGSPGWIGIDIKEQYDRVRGSDSVDGLNDGLNNINFNNPVKSGGLQYVN